MKTGFLITGRLKSTRLPKKLLREVCGMPILVHMIDRIKLCQKIDRIIICTSTNPQDDRLAEIAKSQNVECFRGDEDDVIKRLYGASVSFNIDYIVNITADCPFVDPIYADKIVDTFVETNADLIRALDLPHGAYSYGLKPSSLQQILEIKEQKDTEVWGRYFTDTDLFAIHDLPIENEFHRQPNLRMTLDYPEDLEFFRAVFDNLYEPGKVFSLDKILNFLRNHPEVVEINRHCANSYKKGWLRQSKINLKSRYQIKKAAILGCGSIGQRHIRNLRSLGITDIIALRTRKGYSQTLDPLLEIQEVGEWDDLIKSEPDIAIVSNPTSYHLETVIKLIPHVKGIFIEKPLAASLEGVQELLEQIKTYKVISFVGYNLQFHPAIVKIQEILENNSLGQPLIFQCQVGQWLPDWHPDEDYRQAYYARKDLGGGVSLTLIHEVHLALELLGAANKVSCFLPDSDLLPLDVDVIADLMIQHNTGAVSQIHLDYIQKPTHRCGIISSERGWISYDLIKPKVISQFSEEANPLTVWEEPNYDPNQQYLEEMRTFLNYVSQGRVRHEFDAWQGIQSLAVVETAFQSAQSMCGASLPDWVINSGRKF